MCVSMCVYMYVFGGGKAGLGKWCVRVCAVCVYVCVCVYMYVFGGGKAGHGVVSFSRAWLEAARHSRRDQR